jgi:phospholipid transport system substrate-binding protein
VFDEIFCTYLTEENKVLTIVNSIAPRQWSIRIAFIGALVVLGFSTTAYSDDQRSPDQVVDSVAKQLLNDLSSHREQYRKDPAKLHVLIDKYLLPNFDTEYAAQLVLARHWRIATVAQRTQFIKAFYHSLIDTYGNAVLDFTIDNLKIFPYKGLPADSTATVRSEVRRDNGQTVPVNYSLHKTATGWKAWDVTIEGVSYVHSFRTDFGEEIDQKGLDELIKRLQSQ